MKQNIAFALVITICTGFFSCGKSSSGDQPANPCAGVTITITATPTNASSGQSNGSISVVATGGSGFSFSLNGGAFQSSNTFTNLAAGNYTIMAKNSNGCSGSTQVAVGTAPGACSGVTINVSGTTTNATPCVATPNGSINASATGGTGFTFSVNNGAFQSSGVFSNLAEGSYTVTAKDANGCTGTATITVNATPAGNLFTTVRNIVQTNCAVTGCHNSITQQSGIDFSKNCDIVAQSARIKVRAVDQAGTSSQMPQPPRAALTVAERQSITDWVAAGGGYAN